MEMSGVSDAVVFKKSHAFGNDQVCLQFVADIEVPTEDIRSWCARYLNKYQVPIQITQVEKIDRLPNGKVSRKALALAWIRWCIWVKNKDQNRKAYDD